MTTLTLPPAQALELADRAESRMLAPARSDGYSLRLIGATPLPTEQVVFRSDYGNWLFVDHWNDPTASQYRGKIPIPEFEHQKLRALAAAGVKPDLVWLAHELPASWQEGDDLKQLVPAPAHLRETDEKLVRQLRMIRDATIKAAGLAVSTVGTAASGLGDALAGLDPIVLGGIQHPSHPIVLWALLAQWEWI